MDFEPEHKISFSGVERLEIVSCAVKSTYIKFVSLRSTNDQSTQKQLWLNCEMMNTFACAVVALTAILRVNCLQDIPERGRHGLAYLNYSRHVDADKQLSYVPRSWNSKVDNFDSSSNATFSQRFFENNLYWKSSGSKGPVFFVISGEGDSKAFMFHLIKISR